MRKQRSDFRSLVGQVFGQLTVLHLASRKPLKWECKCTCGNTTIAITSKLTGGHTKSCGCLRHKSNMENLIGQKFNSLTVVSFHSKNKKVRWNCICDCTNETIVLAYNLKNGAVKSCGCLGIGNNITHGLSQSRLATILDNMKGRCYRPKVKCFFSYGGRGITICEEWLADTNNFYKWAAENGYSEDLSIDRIDVNGNYSPDNCRWATIEEQAQNKRCTVGVENVLKIRDDLITMPVNDVAIKYGFHRDTILNIKSRKSYKNIPTQKGNS